MTMCGHAEAAGVRKAPRQEIAVGRAPAARLALWGFSGVRLEMVGGCNGWHASRYEWLRVEWIEASLGAIGVEPTRIRNVRALIVRRHEVPILIVTGGGVGRSFGSE